jgi:hypothetical protein
MSQLAARSATRRFHPKTLKAKWSCRSGFSFVKMTSQVTFLPVAEDGYLSYLKADSVLNKPILTWPAQDAGVEPRDYVRVDAVCPVLSSWAVLQYLQLWRIRC